MLKELHKVVYTFYCNMYSPVIIDNTLIGSCNMSSLNIYNRIFV